MKVICMIILLVSRTLILGQSETMTYISLTQNSDIIPIVTESDLSVGIVIPTGGNLVLFASYQFGGNYRYDTVKAYKMNYHLLGGGIKYRFISSHKIYSPTITAQVLTEIYSNYNGKNIGIDGEGERPLLYPWGNINNIEQTDKYSSKIVAHSSFDYISIPLTFNVMFGNEIKISKNLFLNVQIGYLVKYFRVHKKTWSIQTNEPISEIRDTHKLKETKYGRIYPMNDFEISLGLNYIFSFKKHPKNITP